MLNRLNRFFRDDAGAVTVDWVVLTASIASMAFVITIAVFGAIEGVGVDTADNIEAIQPGENFGV